ncbi:MAG: ABC transporter permease [Bacteroidota bacterium]
MIRNYLKIAWRNLQKNRTYSFINIGGLALGIAACLLILQYVTYEFSYEDFHEDLPQLYRVKQDRYDNGVLTTEWAAGAFAVGNKFKEEIPEIEEYVKVFEAGDVMVELDSEILKVENVFFSSEAFFTMFTYPLLSGDKTKVLSEPLTAVISESTAKKVFGTTEVVGKTLNLNQRRDYRITGVFEDMPGNTQLKPELLLSYITYRERMLENNNQDPAADPDNWWFSDGCLTYIKLSKDADPKEVEAKFIPIVQEEAGEELATYNSDAKYYLHPLKDLHLYSNFMDEPGPTGEGGTVYLLIGIALFIVVIAWVNYINLATARALGRAKEVGIRKTIGSLRKQLVFQFFMESFLFNGLALVLAVIITSLSIPYFKSITGQQLAYDFIFNTSFWLGLIVLFMLGVVLSGAYPALVLSRFKPVEVLKGKMTGTKQGSTLRKSLVVFQFAASLFLLIGTFTVYRQINFMKEQSLGLAIEQTLVVRPPIVTDSTYANKMASFKQELLKYPGIQTVSSATTVPGQPVGWNAGGIRLVSQTEAESQQYRVIGVDYDYLSQFEVKLIAGQPFSEDFGDTNVVIFNRSGAKLLGFPNPDEAVGQRITFWGNEYTVVGVSEDFHQESLKEAYEPLIFRLIPEVEGYYAIKTDVQNASSALSLAQSNWETFFPGNTFEYFFLDDHFNAQYEADQRFGKVFGIFASLAIIVACLGLFGLASFTTLQRRKEIGVRKVLGASVQGILKLLYKEFSLLLFLAFIIAIPIAWFTVNNWLSSYAFHTHMTWALFIIPFATIIIIAFVTISFQTVQASLANPVESLRTE